MKRLLIIIGITTLLLTSLLLLHAEPRKYSFTKAVCTHDNYCQDIIYECIGDEVISTTPITGAAMQMPKSWTDPRSEAQRNITCD